MKSISILLLMFVHCCPPQEIAAVTNVTDATLSTTEMRASWQPAFHDTLPDNSSTAPDDGKGPCGKEGVKLNSTKEDCISTSDGSNNTGSPSDAEKGTMNSAIGLWMLDGLVGRETLDRLMFANNLIVYPIIGLVGILGNMACIIVLTRGGIAEGVNFYLVSLGVTDMCYAFFVFFYFILFVIEKFDPLLGNNMYSILFIPFLMFLTPILHRASAILVVILSLERFVAVRFPLRAKTFILHRHPKKTVAGMYAVIFAIFIPQLFAYTVYPNVDGKTNSTVFSVVPTEFTRTTNFHGPYTVFLLALLRVFPLLAILTLNTFTTLTLFSQFKKRREMTSVSRMRSNEYSRITRLLLVITALFCVCTTPGTVSKIVDKISVTYGFLKQEHNLYTVVELYSALLDIINSCGNFVVYMLMSRQFRETFKRIMICPNTGSA